MQKLIIADDERVIRETIYNLIDWESLDIEVIGLCKDGIEAYNMILDESPDIVMTDIRMPGLSGLELVKKIAQTDQQIQFIILSGYEEFEYAREAMKYGVKYYLLKPCNEEKMIESIQQAAKDCSRAKIQAEKQRQQSEMLYIIHQDAMYHLIIDGIFAIEENRENFTDYMEEQIRVYDPYLNFDNSRCYLYYIFFLEQKYLESFLVQMDKHRKQEGTNGVFYAIYVKNTLLLFCREKVEEEILLRWSGKVSDLIEIKYEEYANLLKLLETALYKVQRYDVIYAIHRTKMLTILNNQNSLRYIQKVCRDLENSDMEKIEQCIGKLLKAISQTSQLELLKMLGNSICAYMAKVGACSVSEETIFIRESNQERNIEKLRKLTIEMLEESRKVLCRSGQEYGILTERVMDYVKDHLGDSDLTLKKIAEEHLYMNVDYVSRKFHKSTGKKFSQYLTEQRIERAKELLLEGNSKIQYVAERVGCGNNPQYFTQIFKKIVGTTPGKWAQQMMGK
ncbi:MAG TPA: response regulator [Candidatus Mediterraneibacter excrementigallinarum]|nr:response regulator [Candidatus Mediterraneibacter excrementigallinarum]